MIPPGQPESCNHHLTFDTSRRNLFVSYDNCFLFVYRTLSVSKAIVSNVQNVALIFKFPDEIFQKDKY